jgi:hypothetical protein
VVGSGSEDWYVSSQVTAAEFTKPVTPRAGQEGHEVVSPNTCNTLPVAVPVAVPSVVALRSDFTAHTSCIWIL